MPKTIEDWIKAVTAQFEAANLTYGHGTDNAWDEAVQAVLYVLNRPLDSDRSILQELVDESQGEAIQALAKIRMDTRKPLPYLTHCAWFMGMPFYVDERVLIPRSPVGEWIDRGFEPWLDPDKVKNILDIGTGSACIAIACAMMFPSAAVDAVDIDPEALKVAAQNVAHYDLENRLRLLESDCFNAVPSKKYDLIISNPPYVGESEMKTIPQEYLHEPRHALVADNEGLAIAERIIAQASDYLSPHGILVVEVGYNGELLQEKYPHIPFTWLEQTNGGEGLFLLDKKQLEKYVRK